jgi:hypothetical protein
MKFTISEQLSEDDVVIDHIATITRDVVTQKTIVRSAMELSKRVDAIDKEILILQAELDELLEILEACK